MATFSTEGLILAHVAQGETDRFITLYTRLHGLMQAKVRAAQKGQSKLAGSAEPFTQGVFFFAQGQGKEGCTLIDADVTSSFPLLKLRVSHIALASLSSELALTLTRPMHPELIVLNVCSQILHALNRREASRAHLRICKVWIIAHFLAATGTALQLTACVRCRRTKLTAPMAISVALGGVVCGQCGQKPKGAQPVSVSAIKLLRVVASVDAREVFRIHVGSPAPDEAERITAALYTYHRETPSPAVHFLSTIGVVSSRI